MTTVDIISGFLGAGKTTLIKKLLQDAYPGEKLVLIENEFGSVNIDGGFLKESGIEISELSAGCICCSLVGDFTQALLDVQAQYHPDRIIIEPSGVGKLSDVVAAVARTTAQSEELVLGSATTVADGTKVRVYQKNFGEFYIDQVSHAGTIFLSRTQKMTPEKIQAAVELLRTNNPTAAIVTTPWDALTAATLVGAMTAPSLKEDLLADLHHHHHHHDEHCDCGHDHHEHHHHDEHCDCGHDHHEHHHHDEHCDCGHDHHEHHHHEHDEHCSCGHHHADDIFTSWGIETPHIFSKAQIEFALAALDSGDYGAVLRAKGIVNTPQGWVEFDYVPEEYSVREGNADYTGRLCVIGADLKETDLQTLFGL